jgi:hypothetical protein
MLLGTARSHILLGILGATAEMPDMGNLEISASELDKMLSAYSVPQGRLAGL